MLFRQITDKKLSQYAYLIGCQRTGQAIVIDPQRDINRYIEAAAEEDLQIVAAADTHIHADYVSGLPEMAGIGARIYASDEGDADWKYQWLLGSSYDYQLIRNGDSFNIGNIRFDVWATPGHTPEHVCFFVTDQGGGATEAMGLLSGDFIFVGDVGRPDLLESAAGQVGVMEPSARRLYHSIQRFKELPLHMQVWPAHGAGSACGKALGAVPMSTVGYELNFNASILAAGDEDGFTSFILDGQPEPPLYFARMKAWNRDGAPLLEKYPKPKLMTVQKLGEMAGHLGVVVVDTRPWPEYRRAHLPGSLFAPLTNAFPTVAGSYVEAGMPVYLIVEETRLDEAVTDLIRIGLDHIVGYAGIETFAEYRDSGGEVASCKDVDIGGLQALLADERTFLLDVRRASELETEGRISGSHNIAHTRLPAHLDQVPRDRPIAVHCCTGIRSCYASALLQRHGYDATNVSGGFVAWVESGAQVANV